MWGYRHYHHGYESQNEEREDKKDEIVNLNIQQCIKKILDYGKGENNGLEEKEIKALCKKAR